MCTECQNRRLPGHFGVNLPEHVLFVFFFAPIANVPAQVGHKELVAANESTDMAFGFIPGCTGKSDAPFSLQQESRIG